jgi:methyltransferase (TIGR00027 family)
MTEPAIQHISDTARWAAVFRARETERNDPLFRDPFARRLAGDRGEEIAKATPFHEKHTWSWVTRTYLFDRIISQQIAEGADLVVNLAAGLDARPYRMSLPASLRWVEVDLPEILDYKEDLLKSERPRCALQRIRLDLSNAESRRSLFATLAAQVQKALVIAEGLLIYLKAEEAAALAQDLSRFPPYQRWVLDIVSPGLLRMLQKNTHQQFGRDVTPLQFAPQDGPRYFVPYGWKPVEVNSMLKTAAGLHRLPLMLRLAALLPETRNPRGSRPWSGVCLLGRA